MQEDIDLNTFYEDYLRVIKMTNKLEVMVVDDETEWLEMTKGSLGDRGYNPLGFKDVASAKETLKARFSKQESFPDIYLCDMLDMNDTATVIKLGGNRGDLTHPEITMSYQLLESLKSLGVIPKHFIAMTNYVSKDDEIVVNQLGIYLCNKINYKKEAISIKKEKVDYESMFPDVNNLSLDDAKKKFSENYNIIVHPKESKR